MKWTPKILLYLRGYGYFLITCVFIGLTSTSLTEAYITYVLIVPLWIYELYKRVKALNRYEQVRSSQGEQK